MAQEIAKTLLNLAVTPSLSHFAQTAGTLTEIKTMFQRALELLKERKAKQCYEVMSSIMDTLCTQCETLRLNHENAMDFWKEVNETWLFCLSVRTPYSSMTEDSWIEIRDSIIAWSDVLEWFGLVDYELGFSEEEILGCIHIRIHELKNDAAKNNLI